MAGISDDPLDGLEERLANHAKAFESLLALTPARDYYGSQVDDGLDPSEQWNRKKQSKEEKRAAKKAKLDPANQKSALDVMKERERKRKRDLGIDDDGDSAPAIIQKVPKNEEDADAAEAKRRAKADKRKEARQRKQEKVAKKKAKADARKAARQAEDRPDAETQSKQPSLTADGLADVEDNDELKDIDIAGLHAEVDDENHDDDEDEASSVPTSPAVQSPVFDIATNHSETSSSSSILPPALPEKTSKSIRDKAESSKPLLNLRTSSSNLKENADHVSGTSSPKIQLPDIDQAELQERLRKRIEALRAQRKADGPESKAPRSRQELLDQRRKKEEQRKAHKKELRRQAKEEEARKREEQLRGSGSPLGADIFNPSSPRPQPDAATNNFSFSRLAFDDGTAADASLETLHDPRKRKGPQDPRTALQAAEKKASRLAGLDAGKRADIAEKDMWLNARKRAHGERVRDDTSLLKKALKRKEKQKGRSEREWKDREQAVVKGREMKQKKRETNLQKRRDEKGGGGKKKSGPAKKKGRPGFEGRFKA